MKTLFKIAFFLLLIVLVRCTMIGQVGIGTFNPQATFHIGPSSEVEKVIIEDLLEDNNPQLVLTYNPLTEAIRWVDIDDLTVATVPNLFDNVENPTTSIVNIPNTTGLWTLLDQDLGIAQSLNIAIGQKAMYHVGYTVFLEAGQLSQIETTIVVRCEVNGVDEPALKSVFKLDSSSQNSTFRMNSIITLSDSFGTTVNNNTGSIITRNYVFKLDIYQNWSANPTVPYNANDERNSFIYGITYN